MITAETPVTPATPSTPRLVRRAWVEQVMGMPVSVHVRAVQPTRPDLEAAVARVYAHLRKVDAVLSTWRADSDLLRLQHGEMDEVHAWVADVTELCLEAEDRTDGLFRAWRRRPGGRLRTTPPGSSRGGPWPGRLPTSTSSPSSPTASAPGVTSSSAPVPGRPRSHRRGGSASRTPGAPDASRGSSRCGAAPSPPPARPRRGGHVLDPRTGDGITRAGSATVVGPDLLWADVWATAAWVDPARAERAHGSRDPAYRLMVL